jgi:hypothetical protein
MNVYISPETRLKISQTLRRKGLRPPITHRKGKDNPFFRKKHTEETKAIIREKRKLQVSSGMKGRHHTDETKKKISVKNWKGGELTRRQKNELKCGRRTPERCDICSALGQEFKKGLCFDHDHNTGKFRGWLCPNCNTVLGLAKESVMIFESLIKYIKNNQ